MALETDGYLGRIAESYKFLYTGESKYGPILKSALFLIGSILIAPFFVYYGYIFSVIESVYNGEQMPEFTDYTSLFVEGFKGFVMLIPVFLISFSLSLLSNASTVIESTTLSAAASLSGSLLSLVFSFITPILLIQYALTRSVSGTYDFSQAFNVIFSKEYIIGSFVLFFVTFVAQFAYLLSMLLILPILLLPIVSSVFALLSQVYYTDIYRRVTMETSSEL